MRHLDLVHREHHRRRRSSGGRARSSARRPRSKRDAAAAQLARARSADSAPASRRASIASTGKRASRSTSSACDAATSSAIRRTSSKNAWSRSTATLMPPAGLQLVDRGGDRGDALEHAALEHRVRELDVERILEGEHHVDAGVRAHAGLEEVGVIVELSRRRPGGARGPTGPAADLSRSGSRSRLALSVTTTAAALTALVREADGKAPHSAPLGEPCGCAGELDRRLAAGSEDHSNRPPAEALIAPAERLHRRLLGGEARRQAFGRGPAVAQLPHRCRPG